MLMFTSSIVRVVVRSFMEARKNPALPEGVMVGFARAAEREQRVLSRRADE